MTITSATVCVRTMCLFLPFSFRPVCVCTVQYACLCGHQTALGPRPPTNLPYITVGTIRPTNLPSILQSEQLLPRRNKMSPIAASTRHIMYHLFHWTLSASLSVSPAWRRSLSFVKTAPCKQQEAVVIVVPLDFTSVEAAKQLWGNGMDRGKRRDGRKCEVLYLSFSKCHRAVVTSKFVQPKSVHSSLLVQGDFIFICCSRQHLVFPFKGHVM